MDQPPRRQGATIVAAGIRERLPLLPVGYEMLACTISGTSDQMRYARLRFTVLFVAAAAVASVAWAAGSDIVFSIAVGLGGLAWAAMLVDETRGAKGASDAFGRSPRGFTRGQVARGIVMSWLIPGLGQIYAGERLAGLLTAVVFLALWVVANLELVSPVIMLPAGIAMWIAGQVRVRRLLGVTWDPLIPSLGELFGRP